MEFIVPPVNSSNKSAQNSGEISRCGNLRSRNYVFDVLVALFGMSSWISVNGLWVELPLIVNEVPEYYTVASYMSIIIQLANAGPILYSFSRWYHKRLTGKIIKPSTVIYPFLGVGCVASFLLVLFWRDTVAFGGERHSLPLFILLFLLSLVDCTSSVLFLPYMATFDPIYFNSFMVGEGLSGLVPATFALMQGSKKKRYIFTASIAVVLVGITRDKIIRNLFQVGGNSECKWVVKINETTGEAYVLKDLVTEPPRCSVEVFFCLLFAMMLASSIAFLLIDNLPRFNAQRIDVNQNIDKDKRWNEKSPLIQQHEIRKTLDYSESKLGGLLLILMAYVCFLSNGTLPSIQTYSLAPYGNFVFHLAAAFTAIAAPLAALVAYFLPTKRPMIIVGLAFLGSVFAGHILTTSLHNAEPLFGQSLGGIVVVISWVLYGGLFSYVKVSIASWCLRRSEHSLFLCGVFTQIGSALGSATAFGLIGYTDLLQTIHISC